MNKTNDKIGNKCCDLSIIIPNRGGTNIPTVINSFKKVFTEYFSTIKFIVITQQDNEPFKRGQLYNIAVRQCDSEYIALIDNDILIENPFNPIDVYNSFNKHPYLAFDEIAQVTLNGGSYTKTTTEKRLYGYGAFAFMSRNDFINSGGFSNLCSAWGREDDILNHKILFKRMHNTILHITHPRRINDNKELTDFNTRVLEQYRTGKINNILDGVSATTYKTVYDKIEDNIRYIGVSNIGVNTDFPYITLYNEMNNITKYMNNQGISICVTAYKSEKYIDETIDSISNQTWFAGHDNWECLIGIDGCESTYNYCKLISRRYNEHFKFFMMKKNCGTYVTTNTLMKIAQYNNLIRFDSDDIMPIDFIEKIMNSKGDCDYMQYYFNDFGDDTYKGLANGSAFITKKVFEEYGGYQPWVCAADLDLSVRMKKSVKYKENKDIFYLRRVHSDSLEHAKDTGMNSEIRKTYHRYINNETLNHPKIKCVTSEYTQMEKTKFKDNTITFIVVNRGDNKRNFEYQVKNYTSTFSKQFDEIKFLVVNQDDNELFMRGQLYNCAMYFIDTEYVGLIDNDVINVKPFKIKEEYVNLNGPYLAFTKLSQITFKDEKSDKYTITSTDDVSFCGFGAYQIFKSTDFIKYNGYSNLCFGWGFEDNIIHHNVKFQRLENAIGHITHPRRNNLNSGATKNNSIVFSKYRKGEIQAQYDGFLQTRFTVTNDTIVSNNIRIVSVNGITVCKQFKYMDIYNQFGKGIVVQDTNKVVHNKRTVNKNVKRKTVKQPVAVSRRVVNKTLTTFLR